MQSHGETYLLFILVMFYVFLLFIFPTFSPAAALQVRISYEPHVRQSVRLSVKRVDCDETKVLRRFLYHVKERST